MANAMYVGVNGVARKVKQPYIGVNGIARKVAKGFVGVGNVARQCFSGGTPISEFAVGDSVFMNVDGVATEFIIVHQGIPDTSIYDSSCDGTWLMSKNAVGNMQYYTSTSCGGYHLSTIHTYTSTTFLSLLDSSVQSIIKEVKIPYLTVGVYGNVVVKSGTNGLSTKCFSLSLEEAGFTSSDILVSAFVGEGVALDYFSDSATAKSRRGNGSQWWLRTCADKSSARVVDTAGSLALVSNTGKQPVRPVVILPSDTLADGDFNIIVE